MSEVTTLQREKSAGESPIVLKIIVLVALFVLAIGLMRYATRRGVGVTFDSAIYVDAARNLVAGKGFTQILSNGKLQAVTHYPPMYPVALAIVLKMCGAIDPAMAFLAALTFAANVGLIFWLVFDDTRSLLAAGLAGVLAVCSLDLLRIHSTAWSEPLFFFAMMLALRLLAGACNGNRRMLVGGAIAGAACMFTRFAGISILPTAVICLMLFGRHSILQRFKQTCIFVAIAAVPFGFLILRNHVSGGSATDRSVQYEAIPKDEWIRGAQTLAHWWLPSAASTWVCTVGACLALVGFVGAVAIDGRILKRFALGIREPSDRPAASFGLMLTVFIATYLIFLIVSISYVDHATPLDWRILSPVFICGLMLQVCQIWRWLDARVLGKAIYSAVLVFVIGLYLHACVPWLRGSSLGEDKGYNSPQWHDAQMIQAIASRPADRKLCSNAPGAILFLCQRGSNGLLKDSGPHAFRIFGLEVDVRATIHRLAGDGELVIFHLHSDEAFDDTRLMQKFKLKPAVRLSNCSIYDYIGPIRVKAKPDSND